MRASEGLDDLGRRSLGAAASARWMELTVASSSANGVIWALEGAATAMRIARNPAAPRSLVVGDMACRNSGVGRHRDMSPSPNVSGDIPISFTGTVWQQLPSLSADDDDEVVDRCRRGRASGR